MDYLEGFLIGPIWSDTEYQTRRHVMVHILIAFVIAAVYVLLLFLPRFRPVVLALPLAFTAIAFVVLVFLTPFISAFYYRIPAYVRPLLLILYMLKYVFAFLTLLHLVMPLYTPDIGALTDMILERINMRIEMMTEWFSFLGPLLSMIAGIIIGGLWLVGEGALVVIALITIPLLLFGLIKGFRQLMDLLIVNVFFSEVRRRR